MAQHTTLPKPVRRRANRDLCRADQNPSSAGLPEPLTVQLPSRYLESRSRTCEVTLIKYPTGHVSEQFCLLRHEAKFKVRTKHGLAEVIRRLYAHQLSIIWRKTLTTIQGKPQHNRAILPVSRLSNREHYVETIVTGMSLGWDLGTRTTRMYLCATLPPPPPQASGMSRRRRRLDADLCDIPTTDRDSAVQKRSFGDNRCALPSPYETAQSTCPHSPVFAGDDATDQELLEVVQVGLGPLRLATCSAWFTCLHARVRHPCPAQHHWRGRPLQRLHLRPQRRQQLGQMSEREQPLERHWAARTTP